MTLFFTVEAVQIDPILHKDLVYKLKASRDEIRTRYASFRSGVCDLIIEKGVAVRRLLFFLRRLPELKECAQKFKLLPKEPDIYDLFELIDDEFASYLHYEVFQTILIQYSSPSERECDKLRYSNHLKFYIKQLNIKEFVKLNPKLEELSATSKKLCLKIDMDETTKITQIKDLESSIAGILGLGLIPSDLKLIDVKEGCLILTFLIPAAIADNIFAKNITADQIEMFRLLSILWIKCGDIKVECRHPTGEYYGNSSRWDMHATIASS